MMQKTFKTFARFFLFFFAIFVAFDTLSSLYRGLYLFEGRAIWFAKSRVRYIGGSLYRGDLTESFNVKRKGNWKSSFYRGVRYIGGSLNRESTVSYNEHIGPSCILRETRVARPSILVVRVRAELDMFRKEGISFQMWPNE